jgi:glutamate/tyrosine decarboxylase-like PLP-dependent enzyme
MDKAASILGIGTDNLIKITTDQWGQMDSHALEHALKKSITAGKTPFFVAATAGTTVRGSYDPIDQLLALQQRYDFWLHVDGAWGGTVFLHPELREKFLPCIEKVNSFTWDFHKMHGVALICNILLINQSSNLLQRVCGAGDGSYLFRDEMNDSAMDLGRSSLQCGRRVDSLKLFLNWKFYGQEGMAQRLSFFLQMCSYAENFIKESNELEMVVPRQSFNVCFRYKTPSGIDANGFNTRLRERLYRQNVSLVGLAYIKGVVTLRLLICHESMITSDIDRFFEQLSNVAKKLLSE